MNRKLLLVIILLASSIGLAYAINQFIITLRLSQTPYEIITPDGSTTIDIPKAEQLDFNTTIGIRLTDNRITDIIFRVTVKFVNITIEDSSSYMGFKDSKGTIVVVGGDYSPEYNQQANTLTYEIEIYDPKDYTQPFWIWYETPTMTLGDNPQIQLTIETKYIQRQ